jgi:hypothetical protein
LAGTVFAYFILPETQGKTLTELSNLFVEKPEAAKIIITPSFPATK